MKRILLGLALLIVATWARAQTVTTGTISTSTGTVTTAATTIYSGLLVSIHGTYGTFTGNFEVSDDNGATWYSVMCTRQDALATQEISESPTDNASRAWTCPMAGANTFRIRASALASGSVSVRITQSNQVSAKGWGGGSGSLPTGLSFSVPTLTVSTSGSGNGQIALSGNTSGTATITAPAVAGTVFNPITISNEIVLPQGNNGNASIQCSGCSAGFGFYFAATTAPAIETSNGILVFDGSTNPTTLRSTTASPLGSTGAPFGSLFFNGTLSNGANIISSTTAPTISSGFGSTPSIVNPNSTLAFQINVGTGGTANSGIIGLPSAAHGWYCTCVDISTSSATVFSCKQTGAGSTTTAPIGQFTAAGAAQAWAASDILNVSCMAF